MGDLVEIEEVTEGVNQFILCDVSVTGRKAPKEVLIEKELRHHDKGYKHKQAEYANDIMKAMETGDWHKVAENVWHLFIYHPLVYILVSIQSFIQSSGIITSVML